MTNGKFVGADVDWHNTEVFDLKNVLHEGENTLEAGTPASFDVLTNEIRGLGLNMQLERGSN